MNTFSKQQPPSIPLSIPSPTFSISLFYHLNLHPGLWMPWFIFPVLSNYSRTKLDWRRVYGHILCLTLQHHIPHAKKQLPFLYRKYQPWQVISNLAYSLTKTLEERVLNPIHD
jgi:hypothetical protein